VVELFSLVKGRKALVNAIMMLVQKRETPEGPSGVGNHRRDKMYGASTHKRTTQ
jgi:hypothetical protein